MPFLLSSAEHLFLYVVDCELDLSVLSIRATGPCNDQPVLYRRRTFVEFNIVTSFRMWFARAPNTVDCDRVDWVEEEIGLTTDGV